MEYWEFLLQKEGDRSWLPLESPDVEILEGRYRVVARSSRANTSVDVRIMHQTVDETPPKRRLQKRSGRTNQDGLMVVFPFTRLQPGLWEVRCSGDILSDFFGKNWQYSVRMQVLPQEHEGDDDWEPDWQQPDDTEPDAENSEAIASSPELQPEVAAVEINPEPPTLEPAIAPVAAAVPDEPQTNVEPVDHPALSTIYSIEQLQHLAEQIVQTGNASPIASLLASNAEPPALIASEPVVEEPTSADTKDPEEAIEPVEPEASSAAIAEFSSTPVQLTLDQTAYIARWGHPFTVSGFVERAQQSEGPDVGELAAQTSWRGEVYVCLRDPQSAQVLVETRQAIATQVLPYPFSCTVEIPLDCRTRLLLGEVTLYSANTAQADGDLPTQEFTITADLDELLEAIAADIHEDELLDLPVEPPPPPTPPAAESVPDLTYLNLSFLDGADASQRRSFHFQSSAGDPLPPQLYKPAPSEVPKPLDLPTVRKPQPPVPSTPPVVEEPALEVNPAETEPSDELVTDLELEHDEFLELGDATAVAAIEIEPDAELDAEIEVDADSDDAIAADAEVAATDPAFQSLKLQDRFWSRLNALAADAELSNWLKEDEPEENQPELDETAIAAEHSPPSEPELPEPNNSALVLHPRVRRPEDEWVAQEIVVDDEPDIKAQTATPPAETQPAAPLSEDELVPTPKLEVPVGELVSGKPITVRVRIPNLSTRIYVKFWITDRQTRSLLDGPRWLVDFTPTGLGDMEATTQLTVPFGSVEIQFEAIAVEMTTQRESHKATAERMVMPPDAPTLPLQEWD